MNRYETFYARVEELEVGDYIRQIDTPNEVFQVQELEARHNHIWITTQSVVLGLGPHVVVAVMRRVDGGKDPMVVLPGETKVNNPQCLPRTDIKSEDVVRLVNEGWSIAKLSRHFKCGRRTIKRRLGLE